jgi:nucleoside-diphosphate-sugar epimerase
MIGTAVREHLAGRYELTSLTLTPQEFSSHVADIADLDAIRPAFQNKDAVVHLAATSSVGSAWDDVLSANLIGTYNVYEAAHRAGVDLVIFASSNHAVGMYEVDGAPAIFEPKGEDDPRIVDHTAELRPDSLYGVSKVYGEALGRYYADEHGLSVICLRIGSFQPKPRGVRNLSTWISHRDMAQMVWRAIESDAKYLVCYGISGNTRAYWDLTSAREQLGYAPEDNAEDYAEEVLAEQARRDAERRTSGSG